MLFPFTAIINITIKNIMKNKTLQLRKNQQMLKLILQLLPLLIVKLVMKLKKSSRLLLLLKNQPKLLLQKMKLNQPRPNKQKHQKN
jgi:hypothetical protein